MKGKKDIKFEQPSDILILFNRYLMVLVAIIILGISLSGYFFLLKPKIADIRSVEKENTATRERQLQNETLLTKLKELENEYKDILQNRQTDLDYLKEMVPDGTQVADLFVIADRLAAIHNFKLLSIEVSENNKDQKNAANGTINQTAPNFDPNTGQLTTTSSTDAANSNNRNNIKDINDLLLKSGIKTMAVHMSILRQIKTVDENGDPLDEVKAESGEQIYSDFKDYLSDLENYVRLMDVQDINFPEISPQTTESQLFNLDIITYYK